MTIEDLRPLIEEAEDLEEVRVNLQIAGANWTNQLMKNDREIVLVRTDDGMFQIDEECEISRAKKNGRNFPKIIL